MRLAVYMVASLLMLQQSDGCNQTNQPTSYL
jgi:hypothetical protein